MTESLDFLHYQLPADWCHEHMVREPSQDGDFQACYECGHVYRTEQELLDVHNAVMEAYGEPPRSGLGERLRTFCGHCMHDF